jgi:putative aldouronate transport system substrate-binding protein
MFCALDSKASISLTSLSENLAMQHYEEISGVHIEWFHPSSATTTTEAINVMLVSGELPDMISNITTASDSLDSLIENGLILRLNELIDQYGYNLTQAFAEYPEFKKQATTYNGNLAVFPSARLDEITRYFESFVIRPDWLETVGLEKPTTTQEWYEVLSAFKTQDPNGNGMADELPFISNSSEEMGVTRLSSLWGFNACFYKYYATTVLDGKITFAIDSDKFDEYLSAMKLWYEEELLDPEYLSTDSTSWKEKILTGLAGSFYGKMNGGIGTLLGSYDYENGDPNFNLEPVGYAITDDGKSYDMYSQDIYDGFGCAISTACEDVETAVKWLDYMYSDEGQILASFGVEGETFEFDENGVPKYTELITQNPDGLSIVNSIAHYTIGGITPRLVNDSYYWEAVMAYDQQRMVYPTVSVASTERKVPVNVRYSQEDQLELSKLMADIGTYYKENLHAFIIGTKPIEELEEFKSTLYDMGLQDALDIMQASYDRYLSN